MTTPEQRIQILYEISLSVGVEGDLTETAQTALSAYLRKLNCSAGAVFERCVTPTGNISYETVAMIPSRAAVSGGLETAISRLPTGANDDSAFLEALPVTDQSEDGSTYYIMSLPGFGVLVLATRTQPLDGKTVAALGQLNEKLATACRDERNEYRLREERDRFETIFTTIDEPVTTVRAEGGDLYVQRLNPAFEATFGCSESAMVGRPLADILGPNPNGVTTLPLIETAATQPETAKIRRQTANGTGEFLFRAAQINSEDRHDEYLVLLVDITEAAARERRLERYNNVTQALSRILRHNIRNDLTVIQAMAERIYNSVDGPAADDALTILEKSESLGATAEKAREMRELVSEHDDQSSIPLPTAISDAVSPLRTEFPGADITVDLSVSDETRIRPAIGVVVRHLAENGIEHYVADGDSRDDGPCVTVSAAETDNGVVITVRDNGPGIPQSEAAMVRRTEETQLEHGSGAGLWIVGQIIQYCDATIGFSTDDGTTVRITVP
jgi:PAS domain S-box-containing protein